MKKVFVGLSGGVDSSVSALLLKQAGFDVTGVFIKAWHPDFLPCNWRAEMRDAMRVCAKLEIPFLMCDLEKEYKKEVIDYLISEYSSGRTPNPDVMCNKEIKFGGFLKFATDNGADSVATGHYAQKFEHDGKFSLNNSIDKEKDQTYFLWTLNQKRLSKILFPIGHLEKSAVRKIAEKNNLHTSSKKDSQGLCFIGHVDIKNFLRRYVNAKPGKVLNASGEIVGDHEGSELYTIGERHGFTIDNTKVSSSAHYIISKDVAKNTITISSDQGERKSIKEVVIENFNTIREERVFDQEISAMIRYRGEMLAGHLRNSDGQISYVFQSQIDAVSPGQSIVFYRNGECLGGGAVDSVM
jgi:tRNA-specific 2-thiouridylase